MKPTAIFLCLEFFLFAWVCCGFRPFSADLSKKYIKMLSQNGDEGLDFLISNVANNIKKGSVIVIKYGGHAMENEDLKLQFSEDIGTLCRCGILPVIVHGGGPQIAKMLKSLDVQSSFVQGLRVTDPKTMEIAQMVLCGSINKDIVGLISKQDGVRGAIGLSGLDSQLIKAKKVENMADSVTGEIKPVDLGLVGNPTIVNTQVIRDLVNLKLIPVIAPIGCNEEGGGSLNINADTAAGAVAEALKADRLLLLTDVTGVLNKDKVLMDEIKSSSLSQLVADGTISGGMIPKLETASQACRAGVGAVAIMDGRVKHSILRALSGEKFGTQVVL